MNNLPTVKLKSSFHNQKEVVQILFERNNELQNVLRLNTSMRWSKTMNCWYVSFSKNIKSDLFQLLKGSAFLDYSELKPDLIPKDTNALRYPSLLKAQQFVPKPVNELQGLTEAGVKKIGEFKNWLRSKRYSENTIGTYTDALKTFLRFYANKAISDINNNDVIVFNNEYIIANELSASFQNQVVNAIKLFFRKIELKSMETELVHRPKRPKQLPNVLSKEEVKLILNAHNNIKHKAMLSLPRWIKI